MRGFNLLKDAIWWPKEREGNGRKGTLRQWNSVPKMQCHPGGDDCLLEGGRHEHIPPQLGPWRNIKGK